MSMSEPPRPFDHPPSASYPAPNSDPGFNNSSDTLQPPSSPHTASASFPTPFTATPPTWHVDSLAASMARQEHERGDSPMPDAQPDTTTIETVIAQASHTRQPSSSSSSFNSADSGLDEDDEDGDGDGDGDDDHTARPQAAQEDHDMADAPPPPPPPPDTHPSDSIPPPPRADTRGSNDTWARAASDWGTTSQPSLDKHPWIPIYEDNSPPGEDELKRLETAGEISAFDHEHWQKKAFKDLNDPEYTPTDSGRIEWVVRSYNGTQENPNKELLMRSDPVMIGGHAWRVKLYPKGNGTSYLGAYVECDTFTPKPTATQRIEEEREDLETPMPLLDRSKLKRVLQVPAQIMLLMYNPQEPRVHFQKKSSHSFAEGDPDRGFSRFGPTPYYDLGRRLPETRQAMLQNDSIGFIAHIRIFNDPTGFLFGRDDYDYRQDFARTGLRPVKAITDNRGYATSLTSATLSFALLPQIRKVIYKYKADDPDKETKPLLCALQSVLCNLRRKPDNEPNPYSLSPVSLEQIADAIGWYGDEEDVGGLRSLRRGGRAYRFTTHWHPKGRSMQDFDVFQIWEYLHGILEEELEDTRWAPWAGRAKALAGPRGFHVKISAESSSIRKSLHDTLTANIMGSVADHFPEVLQVELPRQQFVESTRKWKKVDGRIPLDDTLSLYRDASYTLYGLILHQGDLNSRQYTPILRPNGKGWYKFSTDRSYRVFRITKKQALLDNESSSYIAIYMRSDVANAYLLSDSPTFHGYPETGWSVPERLISPENHKKMEPESQKPDSVEAIASDSNIVKMSDGAGGIDTIEVRRGEPGEDTYKAVIIPTPLEATPPETQPTAAIKAQEANFDGPAEDSTIFEVNYFGNGYYRGTMHEGYRHGSGRRIYLDGNCYEGQFRKDLRHGQGKQMFQNGDTYEGTWTNDEMDGQGVFTSKTTGNVYRGGYKQGKQHGQFTLSGTKAEALKGCLICYEKDRDAVFYPCGHMCACMDCARELEDCPYCHKQVAEPIRLYLT